MSAHPEIPSRKHQRKSKAGNEEKSGGLLGRMAAAMTSLAGIATAIATIMTSVTAGLGVVVHHQATQLHQVHQQVSQQAHQIQNLESSRAAAPEVTATPVVTSSPTPTPDLGGVAHYLSNLSPTVNNPGVQNGQQVITAVPYPNSIAFDCNGSYSGDPDEAYGIAGSTVFTAVIGVADDTSDVTGVIATVVFSNEAGQQLGQPVQVSLGHPRKVRLNVSGVTQLGMTCNGRNAQTSQTVDGFNVALGDAGVS
jgi:hypothetical protein